MIRDVTLTFDNGPTPGVTEEVLEVLRRQRLQSTFFVLGRNIADPALRPLCVRAHREGHWIGNHTYTHSVPLGLTTDDDAPAREISRTQSLIGELSHPARLFRPNGGGGVLGPNLLSLAAAELLREGRYTCVLWNAVPHDWDDPDGWVETALAQCRALPWALVVLHDLPVGAVPHLESFIERARGEGARFRQDFPPDCIAMLDGEPAPGFAGYVAARAGGPRPTRFDTNDRETTR